MACPILPKGGHNDEEKPKRARTTVSIELLKKATRIL